MFIDEFPGTIIFNEEDKSININCECDLNQIYEWKYWRNEGFLVENHAFYRGYIYKINFRELLSEHTHKREDGSSVLSLSVKLVPEGFLDKEWVRDCQYPPSDRLDEWDLVFFSYWHYFFDKYPDYQPLPFTLKDVKEWYEIFNDWECEFYWYD